MPMRRLMTLVFFLVLGACAQGPFPSRADGPAFTEARFLAIEPGRTTAAEVLRVLGPPLRRVDFDNLGQVAWDYRGRDTWGYLVDFSVMVGRDGVVAGKVAARIDPPTGSR